MERMRINTITVGWIGFKREGVHTGEGLINHRMTMSYLYEASFKGEHGRKPM